MTYVTNSTTGKTIKGNKLGRGFYISPWALSTQTEIDAYDLSEAKESKKKEIDFQRDVAYSVDITITTENFGSKDFSVYSIDAMLGKISAFTHELQKRIDNSETPLYISYVAKDNSKVDLTINDFKDIKDILIAREDYRPQGRVLKDQVDTAVDIAAVDAITITFT